MITCAKCGLDCTDSPGAASRLCDACLGEAKMNAQREWSNLMDARRESGRVQVNRTELREDGWHNEATPALETMQDQERYERGLI